MLRRSDAPTHRGNLISDSSPYAEWMWSAFPAREAVCVDWAAAFAFDEGCKAREHLGRMETGMLAARLSCRLRLKGASAMRVTIRQCPV